MTIPGLVAWLGEAAAGCAAFGAVVLAGRIAAARGDPQPALKPVRVRVRR